MFFALGLSLFSRQRIRAECPIGAKLKFERAFDLAASRRSPSRRTAMAFCGSAHFLTGWSALTGPTSSSLRQISGAGVCRSGRSGVGTDGCAGLGGVGRRSYGAISPRSASTMLCAADFGHHGLLHREDGMCTLTDHSRGAAGLAGGRLSRTIIGRHTIVPCCPANILYCRPIPRPRERACAA